MASFMSPTFTTGERRKKAITYGKLSRLPPPRPSLIEEDAPSPERPHKPIALPNGPSVEPRVPTKSARISGDMRAAMDSPDVFDVPSEDDFEFPSTPPAKRPVIQRSKTEGIVRADIAKKVAHVPDPPTTQDSQPPQKFAIANAVVAQAKSLQEQPRSQRPVQEKGQQSRLQLTNTTSQAKVSQAAPGHKPISGSGPRLQRSNPSSKGASRATTPLIVSQPTLNPRSARTTTTTTPKKTAKPATKLPTSLDVFDLPSDDEAASLPIPTAPRQTPRLSSEAIAKQTESRKVPSLSTARKPSELGNLQNRKRKGSVSLATARAPAAEFTQGVARMQRDRKMPKRHTGTSPGLEPTRAPIVRPERHVVASESVINKPKRTRTRNVPVSSQPIILKGESSPAVLHSMLPVEQTSISSNNNMSEIHASDDTMYDIPDTVTTPVRPTPLRRTITSTPGSVTPRQRDLFSTLLSSAPAPKTPASSLAALQLTDKKPRSLLSALARSKSDVAHTSQSRKTRLIDTLKDDDTSSGDDDSDTHEEADSTIITTLSANNDKTPVQTNRMIIEETSKGDTINERAAGDTQNSQISSGANTRPRLTYATQRSYLQEANPEDEFLMSMEMDDTWKMDSQTVSTDDEDGPTSQPRTHHELKKYGQSTMFTWDMEESIREISDVTNRSGRRSAMMDLCTKMADSGFISQLLDSGFMHRLLENIISPNDPIFDFIAAVSVMFVLQTKPTFAVVDQILQTGVMITLISLVDKDVDISKIARDRKSKMSKIAQESLADFRAVVMEAKAWSTSTPEKMSPQMVSLKSIDLLVQSLRESGSVDPLLIPAEVLKIVNVCSLPSSRIKTTTASPQDVLVLDLAISILEMVSIVDQNHSTWPTKVLQLLSEVISVFPKGEGLTKTIEAMKLCMNLTNNKPKACQPFSTRAFVQPLVQFLVECFELLSVGSLNEQRQAALTLSLGAMINLAELSDQARINAVADADSVEKLVNTYVVGSERASQATSFEESEVGVKANFLGVLMGMLCLNSTVRSKIQALLPSQQLDLLLQNMRVFARIHETVDEKTVSRFEGSEGQETLSNYYVRIMNVVKTLEGAKT